MTISFPTIHGTAAKEARASVRLWGSKFLGQTELVEASKGKYSVPPGFAQPAGTDLGRDHEIVRSSFEQLTREIQEPAVILARSNAPEESPGQYETHSSLFRPQDPLGSFEKYLAACAKVLTAASSQIPILGQTMVGEQEELDGEQYIGLSNISFVAGFPSPVKKDLCAISVVSGLGTKAVEFSREALLLFLDREGNVEQFLWKDRQDECRGPLCEDDLDKQGFVIDYRQMYADVFSVRKERPTTLMEKESIKYFRSVPGGVSPFRSQEQIKRLNSIVLSLSSPFGSGLEIEGAFLNDELSLYQMRRTPPKPVFDLELSSLADNSPRIKSSMVFGHYNGELDLLWLDAKKPKDFEALYPGGQGLLEFFQDYPTPYALLSNAFPGELVVSLYYAKMHFVKITTGIYNSLSHLVGALLEEVARGKQSMLMEDARLSGLDKKQPDEVIYENGAFSLKLYKGAKSESNGNEAQIFF